MASQLDKDQAREIAMKMLGIKKGPLADEYAKRKAQPSGPTKTMKAKALLAQDNQDLLEDESDEEEGGYVPIPPKERAMMAIAHTPRMEMCALSRTKGVWYMDSGCTTHMSFQAELFDELHPVTDEVTIMVGNGASVPAHGTGTLTLRGTEGELRLERVLYVPDLSCQPDLPITADDKWPWPDNQGD